MAENIINILKTNNMTVAFVAQESDHQYFKNQ